MGTKVDLICPTTLL